MAHAKVTSAGLLGIDAYKVEVEVDAGRGVQNLFAVVGLPDAASRLYCFRERLAPVRWPANTLYDHACLCRYSSTRRKGGDFS